MKKQVVWLIATALLFVRTGSLLGQGMTPDQIDQLVRPIALYPDPLIAELLPAAGFPAEIVQADRYVSGGGDPNQIPDQGWDPSVQAIAHYPNVIKWMDDNVAWTTQLGQVFQSQQADVMNAIQQLRGQAQNLGNLPSTPQETVAADDGDIEIEPTDPDEMYVPTYTPDTIFYQAGVYCTFPYWLPIGGWLVHDWDWHHHGLFFWDHDHPRPGNWWHESPGERHAYFRAHPAPVWHPGRVVAARGGWDRGYSAPVVGRSYAPRSPAPEVTVIHSAPTTFRSVPAFRSEAPHVEAPRSEAPVEHHEEVHTEPSRGFFGGGQSGHEAVEASSRGAASRGSSGGGGGGGHHH